MQDTIIQYRTVAANQNSYPSPEKGDLDETSMPTGTSSAAPSNLSMHRDDDDDDDATPSRRVEDLITIESLTDNHFDDARKISNEFLATTNKRACGLIPCFLCTASKMEFEQTFRRSPDRRSTYGLAMRTSSSDNRVPIGIVNLRLGNQPAAWDEQLIHRPQAKEAYVEYMAVTKDARGMGAGTKLLEWAEAKAREKGATMLTLGVVNGNPARRLYDRFGFVETESQCCLPFCLFGMPHGSCGAIMMEKRLE